MINRLVHENQTQFQRARADIIRYLVLSEQQSGTQRYPVHYNVMKGKAANSHIGETIALKMTQGMN